MDATPKVCGELTSYEKMQALPRRGVCSGKRLKGRGRGRHAETTAPIGLHDGMESKCAAPVKVPAGYSDPAARIPEPAGQHNIQSR